MGRTRIEVGRGRPDDRAAVSEDEVKCSLDIEYDGQGQCLPSRRRTFIWYGQRARPAAAAAATDFDSDVSTRLRFARPPGRKYKNHYL